MDVIIDGSKIFSEEDFHKAVAEGLHFPVWYGKNLDALWDALTGMTERPLRITWLHSEQSKERLPRFEKIISLLRDAEKRDKEFDRRELFTVEIH